MEPPATISCRLDAIQWPAALTDPRLYVRAANTRFVARWTSLGGDTDVLTGGSLAALCPLEEQLKIRHQLWRLPTGVPIAHSLRLVTPPVVLELTPIEANHEPGGWLVTLRDPHHATIERMNSLRIATLVHDLKMPVQAVVGWVSLLKQKRLAGQQLEHALRIIDRNARLEAELFKELLEAMHPTDPMSARQSTTVDIADLARSAAEALRPLAEEAGVALDARAPAAPITVAGDAREMTRIVSNLLVNAIKFSDRGGKVECSVEQQDGWARLTVRDDGRGITAGFLPHVFDSFHREERPDRATAEGTGLGLAVVRDLAHRYGGFVRAESEGPGCGATFTVTLPSGCAHQTQSWVDAAAS
jgi:signal transduction histidine kinase